MASPPTHRRSLLLVIGTMLLAIEVLAIPAAAAAEEMPQPALVPRSNPLCDSNLVGCLDIDDFGAHAFAHLMVLPSTDRRDVAVVIPYGMAIGLFGRFAGGIASDYGFWQAGGVGHNQNGPIKLDLTALLWPVLPFRQAAGVDQDGAAHFQPVHRLRVGLHYDHELRAGSFDGPNSLGLRANLSALRVIANRAIGPVELTASLGALFDWQGAFATSEAALQLGMYLPFFRAMKVYGEVLGRGVPAYQRRQPDTDPTMDEPIHGQSVLGLGLTFRPNERVDFAVSVQKGLGGLAPVAVIVRFLTLSVGTGYQGRAPSPVAQLAADTTVEIARAIKDYVASLPIDPKLDATCIIRDNDESVMGSFGKPSPNGYYCEEDGFRVPINFMLFRDRAMTKLCRDHISHEFTGCLLERIGTKWVAVHRPSLDAKCEMYDSDGTFLGRLGTPTQDGSRCRFPAERSNGSYGKSVEYQEQMIGALFHTNADRNSVCLDKAMRHCFMKAPAGRATLAVEGSERFAKSYVQHFEKEGASAVATVKDVAEGRVNLTTLRQEATDAANNAIRLAQDPKKAASDRLQAWTKAVVVWESKTPEQQLDSLARLAAGATISTVGTIATGGLSKLSEAGQVAEEVLEAGHAIGTTEKAGHALVKAEKGLAEHASPPHPKPPRAKPHGNLADNRPATLYEKLDKNGNHLKYGTTKHADPYKRYTESQVGTGSLRVVERGPRREILKRERKLVETTGGPENRERWSGKDTCE